MQGDINSVVDFINRVLDQSDLDLQASVEPLGEAEVNRIAVLVKSAIGFDEKRGDHVDAASAIATLPSETSRAIRAA